LDRKKKRRGKEKIKKRERRKIKTTCHHPPLRVHSNLPQRGEREESGKHFVDVFKGIPHGTRECLM